MENNICLPTFCVKPQSKKTFIKNSASKNGTPTYIKLVGSKYVIITKIVSYFKLGFSFAVKLRSEPDYLLLDESEV